MTETQRYLSQINGLQFKVSQLKKQLEQSEIERKKQVSQLQHRIDVMSGLAEPEPEFDAEKFRRQQRVANFTSEKLGMFAEINKRIEEVKANNGAQKLTRQEIANAIENYELSKLQIENSFSTAESYLGDSFENHYVELFRSRAKRLFNEAMKTDEQREREIWEGSETNREIQDWGILQSRAKNL